MITFVNSHFSYCSFFQILHSRTLNDHINRIHQRALRIAYLNKSSSFKELLQNNNSVTIHQRNFQILASDFGKTKNGSRVSKRAFLLVYELVVNHKFDFENKKMVQYGTESLSFQDQNYGHLNEQKIKRELNLGYHKILLVDTLKLTQKGTTFLINAYFSIFLTAV